MNIYGSIKRLVQLWFSQDGFDIKVKPNANTYVATTEFSLPPKTSGSGVLVGEAETQTLTNKTLNAPVINGGSFAPTSLEVSDANFTIEDNVDDTKKAKFELAAITAGTTRTFSVPDASTTLVGTDTAQSLTNKVIDGDANTLQDIAITSLKTDAAAPNQVILRDASGVVTDALILNANVDPAAGIDVTKIGAGTVNNTELGYLDGVTSSIQTQLNNKQDLDADLTALAGLTGTGLIARTGAGAATTRTLVAGSGISITNGDGVAGNPSVAVDPAVTATLTGTQTLTNKTLVAPVIDNGAVLTHETSVTTPAAGFISLYPKADNKLYILDSGGIETAVGTGAGGGEKNYVLNPDNAAAGWLSATATVGTTTTAANLPEEFTKTSAISVTGIGYVRNTQVNLDDVDLGKKLKVQFASKYAGTPTEYTIEVYAYISDANRTAQSGGIQLPVKIEYRGNLGNQFSFDSPGVSAGTPYLEVRVVKTAATVLYMSSFLVGPGTIGQIPPITDPVPYVPPTSQGFGILGTSTLEWRRIVSKMGLQGKQVLGTRTGVEARLGLPAGYTIGTFAGGSTSAIVGKWSSSNSTAGTIKQGVILANTGNAYLQFSIDDYTTTGSPATAQNGDIIGANGATLFLDGEIIIPIAEWAGSGVNIGPGAQPVYAFNSSTSTTTDTTSFAYGETGALIQAFAPSGVNAVQKYVRCTYSNPKFAMLQIDRVGTGNWVNAGSSFYGFLQNDAGTTYYGMTIQRINATDYTVAFYSQALIGVSWATESSGGARWRVVFADTPAAVGFGLATATDSGISSGNRGWAGNTTGSAVAAGMIGQRTSSQLLRSANTALTSTTAKSVVAHTIPSAGTWLVYGNVGFVGSSTPTSLRAEFSTGANTLNLPPSGVGSGLDDSAYSSVASNNLLNGDAGGALAPLVIVTSGAQTLYIVAVAVFPSGTCGAYGRIESTRIG